MLFLPTTLSVNYVISSPKPEETKDETLDQTRKRSKWENDGFICRGHILNGMQDSLFDIYQYYEFAKELWDALVNKYMAEDASSKKFLKGDHPVPERKARGFILQRGRPLSPIPKSYVGNVVSPDIERKLALFSRISKRRQRRVVKLLQAKTLQLKDDTLSWWIDSGASRHVCNSTNLFKTFHQVVDGEHLFMRNNAPIMVQGQG